MISTPAPKISAAVFAVMPEPPADLFVGDNQVEVMPASQATHAFLDGAAAGLSDDIANKKNSHRPKVIVWPMLARVIGSKQSRSA